MTALTVAQTVAARLQLASPATLVGSTEANAQLIKAMIEATCRDIAEAHPWPELQKEYTFTLATSTANYVLPSDFDRQMFETLWNRTNKWPLIGPIDPVEWQQYKSGIVATMPRQRFRVKGWQTNQFYIDPTPTASENGQTVALEYISRSTIVPKTWVTLTSWTGYQYCSYNGNIYDRGGTGAATTGATPPTHTSGTVSDGSINWTYTNAAFETIIADTDLFVLDEDLVTDGTVWRFKRERGLDYQELKLEYEQSLEIAKTRLSGAGVLTVNQARLSAPMIGPWSYPVQNF